MDGNDLPMFLDELRELCLSLPEATEDQPFGPDVLVFRVRGKMFALTDLRGDSVNLKADPERSPELRDEYPEGIQPGYHMNKKHWNTVTLRGGGVPDALIRELVAHSYSLVAPKPPREKKAG